MTQLQLTAPLPPAPAPTTPALSAFIVPPSSFQWLAIESASRLSGHSPRHLRRLAAETWIHEGKARSLGKPPTWEVRSDAHPAFAAFAAFAAAPGQSPSPARILPPRLAEQAGQRLAMLTRWREHQQAGIKLGMHPDAATTHFLNILVKEGNPISRATLYNWARQHKEGRGSSESLVDGRSLPREELDRNADPFLTYVRHLYEHENGRSIQLCHDHAVLKAQETGWTCHSYAAVKRYLKTLNPAEIILRREGPKAFNDLCTPDIQREYESLAANGCWVADHHQFDVLVKVGEKTNAQTGEVEPVYKRPWLTAWMDCRSRKVVGHVIRYADPNTDAILEAFSLACETHGIPEVVYTDNGKDFDNKIFCGATKKERREVRRELFRTRKLGKLLAMDEQKLGGIYATLGIKHMRAWKYHGQSKPVERFFRTVCGRFSKEFETYCGSSPDNRPEGLEDRIERGFAPLFDDFMKAYNTWLEHGYHAKDHNGDAMDTFSGPAEAWDKCLLAKRAAAPNLLEVLLQPRVGPVSVHKNGVTWKGVDFGRGQLAQHFGRKVYLRLRRTVDCVSVWSVDDKELLAIADANPGVPFLATQEDLRAAILEKRSDTRKLRESFESSLRKHETVTERMARLASSNAGNATSAAPADPDPYILQPVRADLERHLNALSEGVEETQFRRAAGAESLSIKDALAAYGGDDE